MSSRHRRPVGLHDIRQGVGALRHRVDALQVLTVPPTSPAATGDPDVLLQVGACCRDHQALRFDYVDKDGASSLRRVEPHRLVSRRGRWYAVAWDLDRAAWRTFRVDRVRPRTPVTPRDETSCLLEVGSRSWPSLAAWLLLFEAEFEVLQPPELVPALEEIRARVGRAIAGSGSLGPT